MINVFYVRIGTGVQLFQGAGGHRPDAEYDDLRVSTLDANDAFDKIATSEIQHARTIIDL